MKLEKKQDNVFKLTNKNIINESNATAQKIDKQIRAITIQLAKHELQISRIEKALRESRRAVGL